MQYYSHKRKLEVQSSMVRNEPDYGQVACLYRIMPSKSPPILDLQGHTTNCSFKTRQNLGKSIILMYLFISILSVSFIQCSSIQTNPSDPDTTTIDTDTFCEIIKPMIFDQLDPTKLEPFSIENCPDTLEIFIQSSLGGEDFVINLVKNKRLISERYFKIKTDYSPGQDGNTTSPTTTTQGKLLKETGQHDHLDTNHQFIPLHNFTNNDDHCHYHGLANENPNSTVAMSIVNSSLLSGFFHNGQKHSYFLDADTENGATILHRVTETSQLVPDSSSHCLHSMGESNSHDSDAKNRRLRRRAPSGERNDSSRRGGGKAFKSNPDNRMLHEPFQSNSSSLYVELLIVHDHSQFQESRGDPALIADRTLQIVNIMNAFYRQLNIFISLVGVIYWVKEDEIELTEDGDATLTNFLKYRYEKLLPKYKHDNAQLITSTSFNGSVVGKALKGPICTHDHSGGVNTDHSHNPAIVAVTLAHELGHNLGMEHDEDDKCKCPDEKCIMSSSSSLVHPKHWSSCSINYLEESRKHGLLDCLVDEPNQIFGPVCGNGFVEEGEDCDLGEPIPSYGTSRSRSSNRNSIRSSSDSGSSSLTTINPCCDRATCKFTVNATCAQGPCCDLALCTVYNGTETRVCRPRKTECDLEELCDGTNEYCPQDVYYHDGIECGPTVNLADGQQPVAGTELFNKSRAYCYNGRCASHESQCQLLWGPTATTSRDLCFEQNVHGNTSGHCGYDRLEKRYSSCEPENAICGMLHCAHEQGTNGDPNRKTGKLGYGFESASVLTLSFFVMSNHARINCHGAIIDAGPGMRDPGLVPNGASCGEEHLCHNEKCVPVYEILHENWCPSDCNGNGICDNMGVCHCNDGTIGTSCYQLFGSNFHLSLILYIIMFFGPMIAILVLAFKQYQGQIKMWWFLHNRKIFVRSKAREPGQQRRMAYNANGRQVSISEPIPLNQQTCLNKQPFFDPLADPWADNSHEPTRGNETSGYRLEPIKKQQLPPPPPLPDYNQDVRTTKDQQVSVGPNNLRPVRSAPPPPVPPHRSNPNA